MNQERQPNTQKEMIQQLWFAVLGSNGNGIADTVRRLETKVDLIEREYATREELRREISECLEADRQQDERVQQEKGFGERRRGNHIALWSLVIAGLALLSTITITLWGG
jgi:hypothetical protein